MTLSSCFPAACRHPAFLQPSAVASALLLVAVPHSTWHGTWALLSLTGQHSILLPMTLEGKTCKKGLFSLPAVRSGNKHFVLGNSCCEHASRSLLRVNFPCLGYRQWTRRCTSSYSGYRWEGRSNGVCSTDFVPSDCE